MLREMRGFRREKKLSSWRRMALHAWASPGDPSVYGTLEIDAAEARKKIAELRAASGKRVTITHLVGRAVALAIKERPEVNSIVRFGNLYRRDTIDVFFQVAFEGGEDLNGAKIARADEKSVLDIADELDAMAREVREKKALAVKTARSFRVLPPALTGLALRATSFATYDLGLDLSRFGVPFDGFGTVMVTNVGGFGLSTGNAPLVPFSRCPIVLLVGEITDKPVVRDGVVVARPILPIGVTFDHRLMDGFQAAKMAARFKRLMENPAEL
jgi:pyruvate/2-oxoglutarate dehydrogenase complex dihydrolipoamide acyltransferase (E2) component